MSRDIYSTPVLLCKNITIPPFTEVLCKGRSKEAIAGPAVFEPSSVHPRDALLARVLVSPTEDKLVPLRILNPTGAHLTIDSRTIMGHILAAQEEVRDGEKIDVVALTEVVPPSVWL